MGVPVFEKQPAELHEALVRAPYEKAGAPPAALELDGAHRHRAFGVLAGEGLPHDLLLADNPDVAPGDSRDEPVVVIRNEELVGQDEVHGPVRIAERGYIPEIGPHHCREQVLFLDFPYYEGALAALRRRAHAEDGVDPSLAPAERAEHLRCCHEVILLTLVIERGLEADEAVGEVHREIGEVEDDGNRGCHQGKAVDELVHAEVGAAVLAGKGREAVVPVRGNDQDLEEGDRHVAVRYFL